VKINTKPSSALI